MSSEARSETPRRLVDAAADLIAAAPGDEVSLRAVCDRVGVKMPTAYHFFGNKQGLIDAVIERGFALYVSRKTDHELSGDPIQDIRDGWDVHVTFGLENPGLYALMYGQVRPGYSPAAMDRPNATLLALTSQAAEAGRLVVTAEQAASHILAANIGVTLRQIALSAPDSAMSEAVRDGVIAEITGVPLVSSRGSRQQAAFQLVEYVGAHPEVLGHAETQLFMTWLNRTARG